MKTKPIKAIPEFYKHIEKAKSNECRHRQEVEGNLQKSHPVPDEVIVDISKVKHHEHNRY
jgi:hypothetical protein